MASGGSPVAAVANRYAGALFDLARERNDVAGVERSLDAFRTLYNNNADLRRLIKSPVISASDQRGALERILSSGGMTGLARDFLMLLAQNRRLFVIDAIIGAYKERAAEGRGEIKAEIVSAVPLTPQQTQALTDALREKMGKTPTMTMTVDKTLLGGMVVRVGSQMIDTSLRTKLRTLEIAMKEAV